VVVRLPGLAICAAAITVYGCGDSGPPDLEPPGKGHVKVIQLGAVGYTEGTVSKATIVAPDDSLAATTSVRYPNKREVILNRTLRALPKRSTYILESWQRPCEAACPMKDPPTDRCSTEFGLSDGESLTATLHVSPGRSCKITTASSN
jgi:hypothetical protein